MSDGGLSDGDGDINDDLPTADKGDIFGDGTVNKTIITEGSGWKHPKKGEEVRISFKITAEDGSVVDEKNGLDYFVGFCTIGPASLVIDKAIKSMDKGEKCSLKCTKDSLYSEASHGDVVVELELEEQYEINDCSILKDKSVMKKTIKEGPEHDKPRDGKKATLSVEAVTDGTNPLPGFDGPKEFTFTCGNGDVCDALECATIDMKKSERAVVTCLGKCRDVGLGVDGMSVEKVVLTLELTDFQKGEDIWSMSINSKIIAAMQKKDTGAKLFKAKRFELALDKYKKVIESMGQQDKFSDEQKGIAEELKQTSELNKAACYLQLGDPTSALATCNLVIKKDRNNVKALFRRAKAHFSRNEHVEAIRDIERVLELEPDLAEAKTLLPQVKRAAKVLDRESKSMMANMCKGFGKLPERKEFKPEQRKPAQPTEPEEDPDTVTVTFRIEYKPQEGETLLLYGGPESLGEWQLDKCKEMRLLPPKWEPPVGSGRAPPQHFIWEAILELPAAIGRAEYKYVIRGPTGERAEEGSNHKMDLAGMGGTRMKLTDTWRS